MRVDANIHAELHAFSQTQPIQQWPLNRQHLLLVQRLLK